MLDKKYELLEKIVDAPTKEEYLRVGSEIFLKNSHILFKLLDEYVKDTNYHPFTQKTSKIFTQLVQKLKLQNPDIIFTSTDISTCFKNIKKMNNSELYRIRYRHYYTQPDSKEKAQILCDNYRSIYEDTYRLLLKPLAQAITNKPCQKYTRCMDQIIGFEPKLKFISGAFVSHIRNSIAHNDWIYDDSKKLLIFDDREKQSIVKSIKELEQLVVCQLIVQQSILVAMLSVYLDELDMMLVYFRKTKKYCCMLDMNFIQTICNWIIQEDDIIDLNDYLEKRLKHH